MTSIVVVGSQWGDEGKGKIIDFLSKKANVIARYQGGDNAGHTITKNGQVYQLRLLPSGILYHDKTCIIGNGVVVNPKTLVSEIEHLKSIGVQSARLQISNRAHVILPYHQLLDTCQEANKTTKIGTTNNGIGPAYMDKAERTGIRMADLLNKQRFETLLRQNLAFKNQLFENIYHVEPLKFEDIFESYYALGQQLKPYITDTALEINTALENGENILFESAQGTMLDIDHGTYPFVTSSNPVAGGTTVGTGFGPTHISKVIGVCKAYTSRVGDGPFQTELFDETADFIREVAHEYGTVTKRPRRIGWFDSVVLRHAKRVAGLTDLSLNCLDVLSGLKTLKICTAYRLNNEIIDYYPADLDELDQCEPIYETLPGWQEDITTCQTFAELPKNAQNYLKRIEELVNLPLATFSVGPDRNQTNILHELW